MRIRRRSPVTRPRLEPRSGRTTADGQHADYQRADCRPKEARAQAARADNSARRRRDRCVRPARCRVHAMPARDCAGPRPRRAGSRAARARPIRIVERKKPRLRLLINRAALFALKPLVEHHPLRRRSRHVRRKFQNPELTRGVARLRGGSRRAIDSCGHAIGPLRCKDGRGSRIRTCDL